MTDHSQDLPTIPDDDPTRQLTIAAPDDAGAVHLGLVGDTYTILVSGAQTAGAYTLIDMIIPPGGGPGPHRHDFEELFILTEGEIEYTFRGDVHTARAGQVVNVPANAPHFFRNTSTEPARMLCMCTPAGQEDFFQAVADPLPTRTSTAPKLTDPELEERLSLMASLAPRYRTELIPPGS